MATYKKRLKKEYKEISLRSPVGILLDQETTEDCIDVWRIHIDGPEDTVYQGEKFILQFKFNTNYPFDSPQVVFVGDHIPVHPHVYTNGHICLSILDKDWSPAMSVITICLSIQSMLSSCRKKALPLDNTVYVRMATTNPKQTKWVYHDDTV